MSQSFFRLNLALLGCLILLGSSQAQYASSPSSNQEKFSLTGSVVNAATGEPIGHALVQLQGMMSRSAFTDGDGHFEFDGLAAGQVVVTARKPGFYAQDPSSNVNLPVRIGPKSDPVTVKLNPFGVIYGRVTNTEGEALEYIPVRLNMAVVRNGHKRWEQMGARESDENGSFRFPNLQPGTFYLAAGPSSDGRVPLRFALNGGDGGANVPATGYPSVFYPSAPDQSSASPIQLAPGQQVPLEFVLNRVPVYKITGSITGFSPEQGVALQLTTPTGDMLNLPSRVQHTTGAFEVDGVPPGNYALKAYGGARPDHPDQPMRGMVAVTVAADVHGVHLAMEPVLWIPITVRKEGRSSNSSQEVAGGRYKWRSGMEIPVSVHVSPADSSGNPDGYSSIRPAGGQNQLVLDNVQAGRYDVEFMPQGGWYVQSADYAGVNLLTDEMIVGLHPSGNLTIVLRDDSATLTGTVKLNETNGGPVSVLAFAQRAPHEAKVIQVYGDGAFRLDGLAPGDYTVFAAPNASALEYSNAEALRPYLSQAAHINLSPGQTTKVDLNPIIAGDSGQ